MEREVIVLDAVYYNLALISMSHKMTNKGRVRILYNSISDKPGDALYPYLEVRNFYVLFVKHTSNSVNFFVNQM